MAREPGRRRRRRRRRQCAREVRGVLHRYMWPGYLLACLPAMQQQQQRAYYEWFYRSYLTSHAAAGI